MTQEEKEVYAAIFKAALALSKNPKQIDFAISFLKIVKEYGDGDNETFTVCWNFLKEHADMENTDENWDKVVNYELEELCKEQRDFRRKMIVAVVTELERRSRGYAK